MNYLRVKYKHNIKRKLESVYLIGTCAWNFKLRILNCIEVVICDLVSKYFNVVYIMQSMIEHLAFDIQAEVVSIIKHDQAKHLLHYYKPLY